MKGLLLKDFYVSVKYCKMFFVMDLLIIAVSFFTTDITVMLVLITVSGMLPITLLSLDERSDWTKYSGTLPYSRAQIVSEKYLFGLLYQAATVILLLLALLVRMNIKGDVVLTEAALMIGGVFVVSLIMPAVGLPLCFKLGTEKGRFAYYIMIGAFVPITMFFGIDIPVETLNKLAPMVLPAMILLYALSWAISIAVYNKRELKG